MRGIIDNYFTCVLYFHSPSLWLVKIMTYTRVNSTDYVIKDL